jgi:C-terminal processing protease CtpA/Prc
MKRYFILFAMLFVFISSTFSQDKGVSKFKTDGTFRIHEKQAYIIKDKDNFKVQFMAPENLQYPAYKNVDLRKDDIILSINGRSVKQSSDFNEEYDKVKPGKDIKLELKRNGKMLTISLKKANPNELPRKPVR